MGKRKSDCGLEVVRHFFNELHIEKERCVQHDRGFTWWAEDVAQRIWSDPPVERNGTTVWKVNARTDFLADFVDSEEHLGLLSELASHASLGGGLIRDDEQRNRIQLASYLYATESTLNWARLFFVTTAATQVAEADVTAKMLAPLAGCSPAHSAHPLYGPRKRHPVLNILGTFVREGRKPHVWTPDEFAETAEVLTHRQVFPAAATDTGVTIEFPFREQRALCEMTTRVEHPSYRNGLMVRLTLPFTLSEAEDPGIVLRCNKAEIESLTEISHLTGSYSVSDSGFSYCNFIPNISAFRGVEFLTSLITFMGLRASWLAETITGDDWPVVYQDPEPPKWMN